MQTLRITVVLCCLAGIFPGLLLSAAEEFRIAPGAARNFSLPRQKGAGILRIRSRLDLPPGKEGWGGYFLRLSLDDHAMPPFFSGNTRMWNLTKVPVQGADRFSSEKQAYFIKGDSDWIAYNAQREGDAFNRREYFGNRNVAQDRNGFTAAYYDMVFPFQADTPRTLKVENLSPRYTIVCQIETASLSQTELVWTPPAGELILPWSLPGDFNTIGRGVRLRTPPGETVTGMVALHSPDGGKYRISVQSGFPAELRVQENQMTAKADTGETDEQRRIRRILGNNDPVAEMQKYAVLDGWEPCTPARLRSRTEWIIPKGSTGALFLLLSVPPSTPAGIYHGAILLADPSGRQIRIPVETEVLPFRLPENRRIHGLWTKDLYWGKKEHRPIAEDLRSHGINTIFLNGWDAPATFDADGNVHLQKFEAVLDQCKKEGFNTQLLIYGLMDPVLNHISQRAGTGDVQSSSWRKWGRKLFRAMAQTAERKGFSIYFHTHDEPDAHPPKTAEFETMLHALKDCGVQTASDCSIIGQRRFSDLLDVNITAIDGPLHGWNNREFQNIFFPAWGTISPAEIRSLAKYAYVQVRADRARDNRMHFGFMMAAIKLKGIWGFSYYWSGGDNYTAWPFPEEDGRWGTTPGWELLREGVQDIRYWDFLVDLARAKGIAVPLQMPLPHALQDMDMTELQQLRDRIIDEILTLESTK